MYADPGRDDRVAAETARNGVYNWPTLVTAVAYGELYRGNRTPRPISTTSRRIWRARWDPTHSPRRRTKPRDPPRDGAARTTSALANQLGLVRELVAAGAPRARRHRHAERVRRARREPASRARRCSSRPGLAPYEALRTATIDAGEFLGDPHDGRIAVGAHADLVLLAADPLADIHALDRIDGVMVRGRWLPVTELRELRAKQVATYGAPPWMAPPALADRAPGAPAIEFVVSENSAPIGAYTMAKVDRDLVERSTLEDDTVTARLAIGTDRRIHAVDIDVERADSTLHASHVRGPGDRPLVGALTPAIGLALASSVALDVGRSTSFGVDALDIDAPGTLHRGELSIAREPAPSGQRAYSFRLAIDRTSTVARIVIDAGGMPRYFKVSSTTRPLIRTWERR